MATTATETAFVQPSVSLGDPEYEFIRKVVYDHCRINLGGDKKVLVATRVA